MSPKKVPRLTIQTQISMSFLAKAVSLTMAPNSLYLPFMA